MSDMLLPERGEGGMLALSRLISQADGTGWDFFDRAAQAGAPDEKTLAQAIALSQRLPQALARLAADPDFVFLLEHLVDTTILQPVQFVALGLSIEASALNTARREGENALVWKLLKLIAEGRRAPLDRPKEEPHVENTVLDDASARARGGER